VFREPDPAFNITLKQIQMKRLLLSVILLFLTCRAPAQPSQVNAVDGLALDGYDPVSYFEEGGPVLGSENHIATYQGVIYRFSSALHREAFHKHPLDYLPAYGGWCAYAMGIDGERVEVDPETYKIRDGRLFLFYNGFMNNTLKKWNKVEDDLLPRADANWNKLIKPGPNEK
jgi:YHS domain-containing protein